MSKQEHIRFQESPRDHRTELPNLVMDMVQMKLISRNAFTLYMVYRRVAGTTGACWIGIRGLAERCGFSKSTVADSRKELIKSFEILNGKSLIKIEPGNRKKEEADMVTIIDIWRENHDYFQKQGNVSASKTRGVRLLDRGVRPQGQKNEPLKKEPFKKESKTPNVHNFSTDSFISPEAIPAEGSFLLSKEKEEENNLNLLDDPNVIELLEMEEEYSKFFRPKIVARWIKQFGPLSTLESIKYFFRISKSQKNPIRKPEAWMENAFKQKYAKVDKSSEMNKEFAKKFKLQHNLARLKINKRYCQNTETNQDYYYNMDPKTFTDAIKRIVHNE